MKRLVKLIVYLCVTLLLVMVIAIGALVVFVNPNQFKPQIAQWVQRNSHVELTLQGDLTWTFFPWLGIEAKDVVIASDHTPTLPFATMSSVQISVRLSSLLRQNLEVNDVVIDGLALTLLKDANGDTNWDLTDLRVDETTLPTDEPIMERANPFDFTVKSVRITNGSVRYKDAVRNQAVTLKHLTLTTSMIQPQQPMRFHLHSDYQLFDPKMTGRIDLQSEVMFDHNQQCLDFPELILKHTGQLSDGAPFNIDATGDVNLDLEKATLDAHHLAINLNDQRRIELSDLWMHGNLAAKKVEFSLKAGTIDHFNYEKLMCEGIALLNQKRLSQAFTETSTTFRNLKGRAHIKDDQLINPSLTLQMPGLDIHGSGELNLAKAALNYRIFATLTGDQSANPDAACQVSPKFAGIAIPIICQGALSQGQSLCRLDTALMGKAVERLIKKRVKNELQHTIEREVNQQLKKNPALKGLLKQLL